MNPKKTAWAQEPKGKKGLFRAKVSRCLLVLTVYECPVLLSLGVAFAGRSRSAEERELLLRVPGSHWLLHVSFLTFHCISRSSARGGQDTVDDRFLRGRVDGKHLGRGGIGMWTVPLKIDSVWIWDEWGYSGEIWSSVTFPNGLDISSIREMENFFLSQIGFLSK